MSPGDRDRDPLPDASASVDDVAEFWDTHDTTDYEDAFIDTNVTFDIRRRRYEVEVQEDTFVLLTRRAASLNQPVAKLIEDALRKEAVEPA